MNKCKCTEETCICAPKCWLSVNAIDALLSERENIVKERMSLEAINVETAGEVITYTDPNFSYTKKDNPWMADLCFIVAKNFWCYASWSHEKYSRTYNLYITGHEKDVSSCTGCITHAFLCILTKCEELLKAHMDKSESFRDDAYAYYGTAFCNAIEKELNRQSDEHIKDWGQLTAMPEAVVASAKEHMVNGKPVCIEPCSKESLSSPGSWAALDDIATNPLFLNFKRSNP